MTRTAGDKELAGDKGGCREQTSEHPLGCAPGAAGCEDGPAASPSSSALFVRLGGCEDRTGRVRPCPQGQRCGVGTRVETWPRSHQRGKAPRAGIRPARGRRISSPPSPAAGMGAAAGPPHGPEAGGHYQFRVIVLGDAAVGKSSLLRCYAEGPGGAVPCPTVGVDFYSCTVPLPPAGKAKLQLWDTAGQERFRSITRSFYRSAAGVLLVFDLTNRASFERVPEWYREAAGDRAAAFVLVGHKSDLAAERAVSAEEAGRLAASLGMAFVETSARSNLNVELAFETLAGGILRALGRGALAPPRGCGAVRLIPSPSRPRPPARGEPQGRCQC
ncbi:ras-related protein Rab-42 [Anser cygnoides]|uniref:ras-related protein Rab-42 n=1 Tax=Anser cygnoides TaxID=8845 RepID=UPI0034D331EC